MHDQMTRLTLRIDFENGSQIGHGKVRLMAMIAERGSIRQAAKELGMSYRQICSATSCWNWSRG